LGGNDAEIGLAEFLEEKKPKNAFERNAVFVYYLQRVAGIPNITLQHIYTCYRYAGLKPPIAFRQSIVDTSYKKQWLNTASLHSIALTMKGTTFVEHDLPSH
jgi:hypothetical protein